MTESANPDPDQPGTRPEEKQESFVLFLLKLALIVVIFRSFFFSPFNIPSESMLPRLEQELDVSIVTQRAAARNPAPNRNTRRRRHPARRARAGAAAAGVCVMAGLTASMLIGDADNGIVRAVAMMSTARRSNASASPTYPLVVRT